MFAHHLPRQLRCSTSKVEAAHIDQWSQHAIWLTDHTTALTLPRQLVSSTSKVESAVMDRQPSSYITTYVTTLLCSLQICVDYYSPFWSIHNWRKFSFFGRQFTLRCFWAKGGGNGWLGCLTLRLDIGIQILQFWWARLGKLLL